MVLRRRSKEIAKERLKIILIHDRIELSPHEFNQLQLDLCKVLAKYLKVDSKEIDLKVNRDINSMALEAKIPLRSV